MSRLEKLREIFSRKKVVTLEEIEEYLPEVFDDEFYWDFSNLLDELGFEIVECRKKGEELWSEIYVNFDKFKNEIDPQIKLGRVRVVPKELISMIKEICRMIGATDAYISKHYDSIAIYFHTSTGLFKKRVLDKIKEELGLEEIRFGY